MQLREMGEFQLIEKISQLCQQQPGILLGIGDDACVWQNEPGLGLASTDSLVEGVHFETDFISWHDLGWKALAVNLSDIAAMGGIPKVALVSLALPDTVQVDDVLDLYRGALTLAREAGVVIGGGNLSQCPVITITLTIIGVAGATGRVLTRSQARVGDKIAVTGQTGSAAAGLKILQRAMCPANPGAESLKNAFLRPVPRLAEARCLLEKGVATAIDISDGLLADLGHILTASKVSAAIDIEALPVNPVLYEIFTRREALEMVISGGEDYELLFTADEHLLPQIIKEIKVPVTVIGQIISGEAGCIQISGKPYDWLDYKSSGWRHFG